MLGKGGNLRVAIYARVSTVDQNADSQVDALIRYAESKGYYVFDIYKDIVTGDVKHRKPGTDPEHNRLMKDAHCRKFNAVLVWKYDRFSRSLIHLLNTLEQLKKLNIAFISMTQQLDTSTSVGMTYFQIMGVMAEFERGLISERTKLALVRVKASGTPLGRRVGLIADGSKQYRHIDWDKMIAMYLDKVAAVDIGTALNMPESTIFHALRRTVCRLESKHGEYSCRCRRSAGRAAARLAADTAKADMEDGAGGVLESDRVSSSNSG